MRGEFLRTSITILALAILATVFAAPNEREDEIPAAKLRQARPDDEKQAPDKPQINLEQKVNVRCPFCHEEFTLGSTVVQCSKCKTPHDSECWAEHNGCTTHLCGSDQCTPPAKYWKLYPPGRIRRIISPMARDIQKAIDALWQETIESEGRELGSLIAQIEILERRITETGTTPEIEADLVHLRNDARQRFSSSVVRDRYDSMIFTDSPAFMLGSGAVMSLIELLSHATIQEHLGLFATVCGIDIVMSFIPKIGLNLKCRRFFRSFKNEFVQRGLTPPKQKGRKLLYYIQDKLDKPTRSECFWRWFIKK